ncbi:unnamed protein product [Anisakis simplex]|uniref:EndoU domain-containing protein n=1 Tax=Anisakis simplex TaxID=6269 RepID=A0A0M3J7L9_ANISI|nr:unnamed protein product [Anisakis simplex]
MKPTPLESDTFLHELYKIPNVNEADPMTPERVAAARYFIKTIFYTDVIQNAWLFLGKAGGSIVESLLDRGLAICLRLCHVIAKCSRSLTCSKKYPRAENFTLHLSSYSGLVSLDLVTFQDQLYDLWFGEYARQKEVGSSGLVSLDLVTFQDQLYDLWFGEYARQKEVGSSGESHAYSRTHQVLPTIFP